MIKLSSAAFLFTAFLMERRKVRENYYFVKKDGKTNAIIGGEVR